MGEAHTTILHFAFYILHYCILKLRFKIQFEMEETMTPEKLVELAKEAMTHAYAPYSGFKVGAALLCADGTVYQGCNIENAAFSPTVCAERSAIFKAVYDGVRDFTAIAVVGGKNGTISGTFPPCGVCRQVLREFC
jgi:cytidine deaminase